MRKLLAGAAFAALMAVAGQAMALGPNILVNGGFETGDFTGWALSGNTGFTFVTGPFDGFSPQAGNYFAALGPVGSDGYLSQTFSDTPGVTYEASFYFGSDGGTPNDFGVTGPGALSLPTMFDVPATPWTFYYGFFTGSGSDTITFNFRNDPGYMALDTVSVNSTVPEASTWAMMLVGFAGLGFAGFRARRTAIAAI